ncbi:MAG: DUF4258 domain-containing protein [Clostridia bacterium]|nr:DUF4258 domain-containing protein [Clostridia bacterium]
MDLNIEILQSFCNDESIMMTNHVFNRMIERGIEYDDIKNAVLTGKIIEQYPDDFPYPSCLVLGYTKNDVV